MNLFKESGRTSPLCVRRRLWLYIYPRRPEVMVGRDREWRAYRQVCGQRGRNLTMTMAILITYHVFFSGAAGVMNTVSVFRWLSSTGKEKMDPDKSAVFAYDAVPGSHLDLAISTPHVHRSCFPRRHQIYLPKCLNSEVFKGYTFNRLKFRPNFFEFLLFNWKSIFVY